MLAALNASMDSAYDKYRFNCNNWATVQKCYSGLEIAAACMWCCSDRWWTAGKCS